MYSTKFKGIVLSLILCASVQVEAMQYLSLAKSALAKGGYALGFNIYTIRKFLSKELADKAGMDATNNSDEFILLNEDPNFQQIINELLDTYADGNKEIKIYGPKLSRPKKPGVRVVISNTMQAFALPDQRIIVYAAIEKALQDPNNPSHLLAKAFVGHEIGHIVNKHVEKKPFVTMLAGGVTFYAAHKGLQAFMLCNKGIFFKTALVVSGAMLAKNLVDGLISNAHSRSIEREADFHLIGKTENPLVLKALASQFRSEVEKYGEESLMERIFETHPSRMERIDYLEKAANELENKKTTSVN